MLSIPKSAIMIKSNDLFFDIGVYTKTISDICESHKLKNLFENWQAEDIKTLNHLADTLFCNEEEIVIDTSSFCIENKVKVEPKDIKIKPKSEALECIIGCGKISKEKELINSFLRQVSLYSNAVHY